MAECKGHVMLINANPGKLFLQTPSGKGHVQRFFLLQRHVYHNEMCICLPYNDIMDTLWTCV